MKRHAGRPGPLYIDMFKNYFNENGRLDAARSAGSTAAGGCCSMPFQLLEGDELMVVEMLYHHPPLLPRLLM